MGELGLSETVTKIPETPLPEIIQQLKNETIKDPQTGIELVPFQGTEEELADHKIWLADKDVVQGLGNQFPYTTDPEKKVTVDEWHKFATGDPTQVYYMIKHPVYGNIGHANMEKVNLENMSFEEAFMLGNKDLWGKGIGKKVATMLLKHAQQKGFKKAKALADMHNRGSVKLLERVMGEGEQWGNLIYFHIDLENQCFLDEQDKKPQLPIAA